MARMGRKPKPTALKVLQGNPGKRPLSANEPAADGKVARPYGLKTAFPSVAKRWDDLAPVLAVAGLLTPADAPAFLLMLHHLEIAFEALEMVKRDGLTRLDEAKVERKHPALQIFRDNSAQARQFITEFGMTPSSRSGLKVPEPEMPTLADVLFKVVEKG